MHVQLDMSFGDDYHYKLVTKYKYKNLKSSKKCRDNIIKRLYYWQECRSSQSSIELIDVALSNASENKWITAPRIILCGQMIGITEGHADLSMIGDFTANVMNLGPEHGTADGV